MMEELKFALNKKNEGGLTMDKQATAQVETPEQFNQSNPETQNSSSTSPEMGTSVQNNPSEINNNTEGFKKAEEEEKKGSNPEEEKKEDPKGEEKNEDPKGNEDEEKKKSEKNALETELAQVKADFAALQEQFASLQNDYKALVEFKKNADDEKKDALIASFYFLSDEDKADVIANKSNYSLDEIESKLSVISVRKKVSFATEEATPKKEVTTTFNLNAHQAEEIPAWLKAVDDYKKSKDNY
jgi:hypothetical protein